jgi:hypothetical protein
MRTRGLPNAHAGSLSPGGHQGSRRGSRGHATDTVRDREAPGFKSRAPTKFRMRFASSRCLALLAFGPVSISECWANYSLDGALIAAGGQGLLCVGKAIFASDQIVKTY